MFTGSIVALITPMHLDGSVAYEHLQALIEWHIQMGTSAIVILGTTGEGSTLDLTERYDIITFTIAQAAKRIPIIVGTGTNCTRTTVILSEQAQNAGANACLIVTPYYNKPPQNGLQQHYQLVAESIDLPIILYNVPQRTMCDLAPQTLEKLAVINNIIGIKDATARLSRLQEIHAYCGQRYYIYSGDDATALEWLLQGAQGVISVAANVIPRHMQALCHAVAQEDHQAAQQWHHQLYSLFQQLSCATNPIPIKWLLHHMNKIPAGIRLPLTLLSPEYHQALATSLHNLGA